MAGGVGSRFWPLSTNENPKQFLDILGTGYRVSKKGKDLEFSLGFSHSVTVNPIGTNDLSEENQNIVFVRGSNKQTVGEQAASVFQPPRSLMPTLL